VRVSIPLQFTHPNSQINAAKESRQNYTLDPIPKFTPLPQPVPPAIDPTPQTQPVQVPSSIGAIWSACKARPQPTLIGKRPPAKAANTPQVEAPKVQSPPVTVSRAASATPTEPNTPFTTTIAEPNVLAVATTPPESDALVPPGETPPQAVEPGDDASDNMSYTSTIPDDNPAPSSPNVPTTLTTPTPARIETATASRLGVPYIIEKPPTLLSEDMDVRPQWLTTAVKNFLKFVPYVGGLGTVVDLYLAQEARLGYPESVCSHALPFYN